MPFRMRSFQSQHRAMSHQVYAYLANPLIAEDHLVILLLDYLYDSLVKLLLEGLIE